MESQKFNKENLVFNKSAVKMGFDALSALTGQAAVASDILLAATPAIPEEEKKVVSSLFKESQKGLDNLKTHVEKSLELDWTAKDAPVKSLETMENFCKDAFSQAGEIMRETKTLAEKATKQLPKEAKPLVDLWNQSVNNGFEFFKSCVDKNFELARKVMTDVSASTPATEPKAAK
jgi:paraquat-inducible protein B